MPRDTALFRTQQIEQKIILYQEFLCYVRSSMSIWGTVYGEPTYGKLAIWRTDCGKPGTWRNVVFPDRMAALYCILDSRIVVVTNEDNQPVALAGWRDKYTLHSKGVAMRAGGIASLKMSFNENLMEFKQFHYSIVKVK